MTEIWKTVKNLPQVNHIDCDKTNNRVDNLEWISCSDNGKHAWNNNLHENSERMIKVNKVDKNGNIIKTYRSIAESCRKNNIKTITNNVEFLKIINQ